MTSVPSEKPLEVLQRMFDPKLIEAANAQLKRMTGKTLGDVMTVDEAKRVEARGGSRKLKPCPEGMVGFVDVIQQRVFYMWKEDAADFEGQIPTEAEAKNAPSNSALRGALWQRIAPDTPDERAFRTKIINEQSRNFVTNCDGNTNAAIEWAAFPPDEITPAFHDVLEDLLSEKADEVLSQTVSTVLETKSPTDNG